MTILFIPSNTDLCFTVIKLQLLLFALRYYTGSVKHVPCLRYMLNWLLSEIRINVRMLLFTCTSYKETSVSCFGILIIFLDLRSLLIVLHLNILPMHNLFSFHSPKMCPLNRQLILLCKILFICLYIDLYICFYTPPTKVFRSVRPSHLYKLRFLGNCNSHCHEILYANSLYQRQDIAVKNVHFGQCLSV